MLALEIIAEHRIEEAIARGELDNLPGAGKPLDLYDDPLLPPETRMAKRILRNAELDCGDLVRELRERFSLRERLAYDGRARSARVAGTEKVASGNSGSARSHSM